MSIWEKIEAAVESKVVPAEDAKNILGHACALLILLNERVTRLEDAVDALKKRLEQEK